jgi:hypothetical protein
MKMFNCEMLVLLVQLLIVMLSLLNLVVDPSLSAAAHFFVVMPLFFYTWKTLCLESKTKRVMSDAPAPTGLLKCHSQAHLTLPATNLHL